MTNAHAQTSPLDFIVYMKSSGSPVLGADGRPCRFRTRAEAEDFRRREFCDLGRRYGVVALPAKQR